MGAASGMAKFYRNAIHPFDQPTTYDKKRQVHPAMLGGVSVPLNEVDGMAS